MVSATALALESMDWAFATIESRCSPAEPEKWQDTYRYRFADQNIYSALLIKLARRISSSHAALELLERGFFQEQAVLQRTLDELDEDIVFLALATNESPPPKIVERYLKNFFQDELDIPGDPIRSTQKRSKVPRHEIRDFTATKISPSTDGELMSSVSRTLFSMYSGFVHGNADQIMDMYGGHPPRFLINGMSGTAVEKAYRRDYLNYCYRGMISCVFVAKVMGHGDIADRISEKVNVFEAFLVDDY